MQIIRKIEEQLRKHGQETHAIFVVFKESDNRSDTDGSDKSSKTLAALREAFPPEVRNRIFIVINRIAKGKRISPDFKEVVHENFSWNNGTTTIPRDNYITEDPVHIADFNAIFADGSLSGYEQEQRAHTENNLRNVLKRVSQFDTPLPLNGYPSFLEKKHNSAEVIYKAVKLTLSIDKKWTEVSEIEREHCQAQRDYRAIANQHRLSEGEKAACFFTGPIGWLALIYKDNQHSAAQNRANSTNLRARMAYCKEHLEKVIQEIYTDSASLDIKQETLQNMADEMLHSEYQRYRYTNAQYTKDMLARVKTHFPELYHDARQEEKIDDVIKGLCADINI